MKNLDLICNELADLAEKCAEKHGVESVAIFIVGDECGYASFVSGHTEKLSRRNICQVIGALRLTAAAGVVQMREQLVQRVCKENPLITVGEVIKIVNDLIAEVEAEAKERREVKKP